jgi:hypothetical protein
MRQTSLVIFFALVYLALLGQDKPLWLDNDFRSLQFPSSSFLTGYAEGNVNAGETAEKAVERIKTTAQNSLLESVRVNMKSNTQSSTTAVSAGNNYSETEMYNSQTSKSADAEITGMKVESYTDKKTNYIYAFAYANRYEVIGYYKSILSTNISQIEGLLQTAQNLETNKEKAKARQQCEITKPLFDKVRYAQDMLTAIDAKISAADLQQTKIEQMYNTLAQLQARLDVKYELIDNYKGNLEKNITQVEGLLQTAQDLVNNSEKPKARQQCEMAKPLFDKIRETQKSLSGIAPDISTEDLQQKKVEQLYNTLTQMSARLAQAVLVYVESNEDLFEKKVNIVANKLKAEMAVSGCSFTDDAAKADFLLRISATTRESSVVEGIVFCHADVAVELYDTHKQKSVYGNEISQKGGSSSAEKAGHKALSDVAIKIAKELKNWVQ